MKRIGSPITLYWAAYFLAVQISLGGCASYQGKPVPMPVPEMMPYSYRDNHVEIYADLYLQLDRQKQYFDADLAELGVIPIQVVIRNKSDRSFELTYQAFSLELADGTKLQRSQLAGIMWEKGLSPEEREKITPIQHSKLADEILEALFTGPALAGIATFLLITSPLWGPFAYNAYRSKQAVLDRLEDYDKKELKSYFVLTKDQSADGFLFFLVPPDSDLTAPANLVFSFEKLESPAIIRLFLKDLGSRQEESGSVPEKAMMKVQE